MVQDMTQQHLFMGNFKEGEEKNEKKDNEDIFVYINFSNITMFSNKNIVD